MSEKSNYFPERRINQPTDQDVSTLFKSLTAVWVSIIVLAASVIVVICVQSHRWTDQQIQICRIEAEQTKLRAGVSDLRKYQTEAVDETPVVVVSDIEFGRFMTLFNEAVAGGDDTLAPFVFRWESNALETQVTWEGVITRKNSVKGVYNIVPIGTSEDDVVYARFADDGGYDSSRSIGDTVTIKGSIHIFGNSLMLLECHLIDTKD